MFKYILQIYTLGCACRLLHLPPAIYHRVNHSYSDLFLNLEVKFDEGSRRSPNLGYHRQILIY